MARNSNLGSSLNTIPAQTIQYDAHPVCSQIVPPSKLIKSPCLSRQRSRGVRMVEKGNH
jgi:hypothetical protein